jgi:8-oxo-dGTP pyrophosphatase MutT (NUDIX family)
MNLILNANTTEPTDYEIRNTVKAVVVNNEGKVLLFTWNLIGGGVDEGETFEEALHREALEEAGMEIEIVKSLGEVVAYRDFLRKKYFTKGFLCKVVRTISEPTTTDDAEKARPLLIEKPEDSIARLEKQIDNLEKENPEKYEGDTYQAHLYNQQTTLAFLREAKSSIEGY